MDTVGALGASTAAVFVVPLGIGAHLEGWGVPADARRRAATGRSRPRRRPGAHRRPGPALLGPRDSPRQHTLGVVGRRRAPGQVFFSGDTGYFDGFPRIAAEHGPFDLTIIDRRVQRAWPDIHIDPAEAIGPTSTSGAPA